MNLYDYYDCEKVELIDVDGDAFIGKILYVFEPDEIDSSERELDIETNEDRIIRFKQSEIKRINVLKQ